jgi:hypothetical protein
MIRFLIVPWLTTAGCMLMSQPVIIALQYMFKFVRIFYEGLDIVHTGYLVYSLNSATYLDMKCETKF